jgi:hypothetical protein
MKENEGQVTIDNKVIENKLYIEKKKRVTHEIIVA